MNQTSGSGPAYPYRYAEQFAPPPPVRVTDVALTTFEHVYEVDPRLMQLWVLQQTFPNWDSLRIMSSRHDHLEWMHRHFADTVINGSSLLAEMDAETPTAGPPGQSQSMSQSQSTSQSAESTTRVWSQPETD